MDLNSQDQGKGKGTKIKEIIKYFSNCSSIFLRVLPHCVFLFSGILHSIIFNHYLDSPTVHQDNYKYPILNTISSACPIIGLYGAVVIKLYLGFLLNVLKFFIFALVPLVLLIFIVSTHNFSLYTELSVICVLVPISVIGIHLFQKLRDYNSQKFGERIGEYLTSSLNIMLNLLFHILVYVFIVHDKGLTDPIVLIKYASFVFLVTLLLLWTMIHASIFRTETNEIQILTQGASENYNNYIKTQAIFQENLAEKKNLLKENKSFIASVVILLGLLSVEIALFIEVSENQNKSYSDSENSLAVFYIPAAPVFIFTGITFSSFELPLRCKTLIILLFFSLVPLVLFMWLSYYLTTVNDTFYLGVAIAFSVPSSLIYWLCMSNLFQRNKTAFKHFSAVFCWVLVIPVGFILPFYLANGMSYDSFWVTFSVLFFFGASLLIFQLLQSLFKASNIFNLILLEFEKLKPKKASLCIYSTCFIAGYSLVSWNLFKSSYEENNWTTGYLAGSLAVLVICLFDSLYTQQVKLFQLETRPENIWTEPMPSNASSPKESETQSRLVKTRAQIITATTGTLITLAIGVPVYACGSSSVQVSTGITVLVEGFFFTFFFTCLIELKHFLKQPGQKATSVILSYFWLFFILPVVVFIPVVISNTNSQEDKKNFTSWSVGSILLNFSTGLSVGCIILSILFQRLEYEKISNYCCSFVQEVLKGNGVNSKLNDLKNIYAIYFNSSDGTVKNALLSQTLYSCKEYEGPDIRFSKILFALNECKKNEAKAGKKGGLAECCRKLFGKKNPEKLDSEPAKEKKTSSNKDYLPLIKDAKNSLAADLRDERWENKVIENHVFTTKKQEFDGDSLLEDKQSESVIEEFQEIKVKRDTSEEEIPREDELVESLKMPSNEEEKLEEIPVKEESVSESLSKDSKDKLEIEKYYEHLLKYDLVVNSKDEIVNGSIPSKDSVEKESVVKETKTEIELEASPDNTLSPEKQIKNEKKANKEIIISKILINEEAKNLGLKLVFNRCSTYSSEEDNEPWMDLTSLRKFIRILGLAKKIPKAACDILYVSLTRPYDSAAWQVINVRINFDLFLDRMIPEMAKNQRVSKEAFIELIIRRNYTYLLENILEFNYILENDEVEVISSDRNKAKKEKFSLVPITEIQLSEKQKVIIRDIEAIYNKKPERLNKRQLTLKMEIEEIYNEEKLKLDENQKFLKREIENIYKDQIENMERQKNLCKDIEAIYNNEPKRLNKRQLTLKMDIEEICNKEEEKLEESQNLVIKEGETVSLQQDDNLESLERKKTLVKDIEAVYNLEPEQLNNRQSILKLDIETIYNQDEDILNNDQKLLKNDIEKIYSQRIEKLERHKTLLKDIEEIHKKDPENLTNLQKALRVDIEIICNNIEEKLSKNQKSLKINTENILNQQLRSPKKSLKNTSEPEEALKGLKWVASFSIISTCFSKCLTTVFQSTLELYNKIFDSSLFSLNFGSEDGEVLPMLNNSERLAVRVKSPNWDQIIEIITTKLKENDREIREKISGKTKKLKMNLVNMTGILVHLVDIYCFSSIGFSSAVGWEYGSSFKWVSEVFLADIGCWVYIYWISTASAIVFLILLYPAIQLQKQGRLGLNEDFSIAKPRSLNFWLCRCLGLLGSTMYLTVMCSFFSAFSCVYSSDSWELMRSPNIKCFSNEHLPYFIISVFVLFVYFPASTLVYPHLASRDNTLEVKNDPTYLVIECFGKVLIAGFSVFFDKEKFIWLQLIVSLCVALVLLVVCLKMKPCCIEWYCVWKCGGFIMSGWICTCALVKYYSGLIVLPVVLLAAGLGVIIIGSLIKSLEKYRSSRKIKVGPMDLVNEIDIYQSEVISRLQEIDI